MDNRTDRIVPLDELDDFEIAEGDPDVRGWEVLSADGQKIGEVDNLLIDPAAMKVRYLDVDLESSLLENNADRHILVPIGYARLDEGRDRVLVDGLNRENLQQIPEYRHEPLTREYEDRIRGHFEGGFAAPLIDDQSEPQRQRQETFRDDRFFATSERPSESERSMLRSEEELSIDRHRHQAGEVEIDKHVDHERVSRTVPRHREEVIVEHRPAPEGMTTTPRIEEEQIRIPVEEEELDVSKRVVPREEIVVRKQDHVVDEQVEEDLRREEVDIRRQGDVDVREER